MRSFSRVAFIRRNSITPEVELIAKLMLPFGLPAPGLAPPFLLAKVKRRKIIS
jgi:hypothetical protein